ncbi:MAG: hypothetical protein FWJ66_13140 [Caldibacillus sp.]
MENILNDEEKEVLNYILEVFALDHFNEIGYDENGNPISYNDDEFRLHQFKMVDSIIKKLGL